MAYLVQSCNGEESFNKFWSPDPDQHPDNVRGGPSHGPRVILLVYKIKSIAAIVFEGVFSYGYLKRPCIEFGVV